MQFAARRSLFLRNEGNISLSVQYSALSEKILRQLYKDTPKEFNAAQQAITTDNLIDGGSIIAFLNGKHYIPKSERGKEFKTVEKDMHSPDKAGGTIKTATSLPAAMPSHESWNLWTGKTFFPKGLLFELDKQKSSGQLQREIS